MYEAVCPILADAFVGTYREQEIRHILYTFNPRGKSSRIKVENVSDDCLLFGIGQLIRWVASFSDRDVSLHSVAERGLGDVVHLRSASDGYFFGRTDCLNSKDDSSFLGLDRYGFVVVVWTIEV